MTTATPPAVEPSVVLPVHLSHFVGREAELADLAALFGRTRLLTLTGAGGSGKTRLAAELAARSASTFDGTWWVDLAPLTQPSLITHQIAETLGIAQRPGITPLDAVIADLGDLRALLVLDNCEHLVEACAPVVETLLRQCPGVSILATSREALSIASETAWLVPPLATGEAIQLFVERASAQLPSFRLTDQNDRPVAEICRRLDGLPLAIELAAARVRALSPATIAERLDDAFKLLSAGSRTALPRQRTLRGTMDWSYQLLVPREQALLRRLATFAGTFSLDAVEEVCPGDVLASEDILDGIAALVDKSLVVMTADERGARYHLLETVRQYCVERLAEAGEVEALRERHAHWFVRYIESLEGELIAGERLPGQAALVHLDADNLRVAMQWALAEPSRNLLALRFVGATFWYWYGLGQFLEARAAADLALATADESEPVILGRALLARGLVALAQGDAVETRGYLSRASTLLAGAETKFHEWLVARIKFAATYVVEGDPRTAMHQLRELEEQGRAAPHQGARSFWLFWTGWAAMMLGDLRTAREMLQRNHDEGRAYEHATSMAHSGALLGRVALLEQSIDEAHGYMLEGLVHHRVMGEGWGLTLTLGGLARIASLRDDHATAVQLQAGLDTMRERFGLGAPEQDRLDRELVLDLARPALGDAFDALYATGRALNRDALADLAMTRVGHTAASEAAITGTYPVVLDPKPGVERKLRVEALGALQVYRDDELLDASAWGSARPRELLAFLLLHPDGVTKEQVGLAFWPEASSSQLRNSFHVTLHRLRKVLGGTGTVVVQGERYRIAPTLSCEFDARLFEREISAARAALRRGERDAAGALENALRRYRGDLLDGEPAGDWHQPFRDHLRSLYLEASLELAALQMGEERYARAVDTLRRVLARDDLHEGAVRALMTCQARLGERAQALRSYERLATLLRRELEAEPEEETAALAARIQQGLPV